MPTVVVRRAVRTDAAAIATVHVRSWQHAYAGLLPQSLLDGLTVEEGTARWTSRLEQADSPFRKAVAEATGTVVGFAVVGPCRDEDVRVGTGELTAVYVAPCYLGRGVGHLLHEWAICELAMLGLGPAVLWVLATNRRARDFYERHGWRPDGVDKDIDKHGVSLHATRYSRAGTGTVQGTTTSLPRV